MAIGRHREGTGSGGAMVDLVMLALVVGAFALLAAYVAACERL
jgi:hypothetical protein